MESWIEWALKGLLSGMGIFGLKLLSDMKKSMSSLDKKLAVMVERTHWHSQHLKKLDDRIYKFEQSELRKHH